MVEFEEDALPRRQGQGESVADQPLAGPVLDERRLFPRECTLPFPAAPRPDVTDVKVGHRVVGAAGAWHEATVLLGFSDPLALTDHRVLRSNLLAILLADRDTQMPRDAF